MDTISKQLNFEFNPNIDKTRNLEINVNISCTIILILEWVGWDWNRDLYIVTSPKKVNFKSNPNIYKTTNLDQKH